MALAPFQGAERVYTPARADCTEAFERGLFMTTEQKLQDTPLKTSRLDFGLFHEFARRQGHTMAEAFDESFELVDAAEAWGLDAVWLAELHVQPNRTVLASPLTIASAIAARTTRIKIGTG